MRKNGEVTASTAPTRGTRAAKPDQVCADAVEVALLGLDVVDPGHVGQHLGVVAEGDRLVTHFFECGLPGYRGWRWAVTVTRIPRSRQVTICESTLLPGPDALRAPEWVPWQERLQPGDLGVGDLLPTPPDDPRLAPGYVRSDDPAVEEVNWELGLGRVRVMSREGRLDAAQRWYDGDRGPNAPISVAAPALARCASCGFFLQLAGSLRQAFGVCGNEFAPDDAQVVSADHGCGAHSEVLVEQVQAVDELPTVFDDSEVESVSVSRAPGSVDEAGPAEPYGHG
ncbi:DUF3027 domain-containing protein [Dactylosporangium roseum]|uniref:DUF3027 domain-containing protein n=1 Tax=Dactylosporangium roseum TaxID=47989 RepID=A0ABY5Z7D1_9ACTN|nr:DUF3027 domain-containing protein [Dactylosporangium roseum]UWZ36299.1 DUF3027 domain-containing protein [Dactylosporangium roseum]